MVKNIIVETDIGRDPDDFFALLYLFASGVNIRAINVSPGDPDQVAVVKFILNELGFSDIPVGVGILGRDKRSVGSIHTKILNKYKYPIINDHDGYGVDILKDIHKKYPDSYFFSIGPIHSLGNYLEVCKLNIEKSFMQGGFIGYRVHGKDVPKLDKFEGLDMCNTFNLGGFKKGSLSLINSSCIKERYFIGKNICHTIIYDQEINNKYFSGKYKSRAGELFKEGMNMYLKKHKMGKKFHDPSAAVCMLHPDIATFIKAKLKYDKGKWGSFLDENGDNVAIDINTNKMWELMSKVF